MSALNFTSFSGAVPLYAEYTLEALDGVLCIVPEPGAVNRRYDPFADMDGLLLDVVRTGAQVAACDAFLEYCIGHKMLPLRDAEFWLHGDFFATDGTPLADTLLAFARRYGLPLWDMVTTSYPARYAQRLLALRQGDGHDTAYMALYEAAKRACRSAGAVPVCNVALLLLDFYLKFAEGLNDGQFTVRSADWSVSYGKEKTPRLTAQVYDLATCINLAYAFSAAGEGKAVRQCKHCRQFFITSDRRSEYCSPQCRGAYNSKMTRKRVKERKQREGQ